MNRFQRTVDILINLIKQTCGDTPKLGCEVGVWEGETSRVLLESFPSLELLMVDRFCPYYSKTNISLQKINDVMLRCINNTSSFANRRVILVGDSASVVSQLIQQESLDFVYIDGNHSYSGVDRDLRVCWSKVKRGGLFCGHDYSEKYGKIGVKQAVDFFAEIHNSKVIYAGELIWMIPKK